MSELEYPKGSFEWASRTWIVRKCSHGYFDPYIGCPKCKEEQRRKRARDIFENVIWPEEQDGKQK